MALHICGAYAGNESLLSRFHSSQRIRNEGDEGLFLQVSSQNEQAGRLFGRGVPELGIVIDVLCRFGRLWPVAFDKLGQKV